MQVVSGLAPAGALVASGGGTFSGALAAFGAEPPRAFTPKEQGQRAPALCKKCNINTYPACSSGHFCGNCHAQKHCACFSSGALLHKNLTFIVTDDLQIFKVLPCLHIPSALSSTCFFHCEIEYNLITGPGQKPGASLYTPRRPSLARPNMNHCVG